MSNHKTNTSKVRACRICGCTDDDCHQCIEKIGVPCYWVEWDLCSACTIVVKDSSLQSGLLKTAAGKYLSDI